SPSPSPPPLSHSCTTSTTDPPSSPSSTPPRRHHPPISPQPPSYHHLLLATTKGCVGFAEAPLRVCLFFCQPTRVRGVATTNPQGCVGLQPRPTGRVRLGCYIIDLGAFGLAKITTMVRFVRQKCTWGAFGWLFNSKECVWVSRKRIRECLDEQKTYKGVFC
nr:hypothetical protein [Tanacetum cinerariifolium]